MAGLFAVFALAILSVIVNQRIAALVITLVGILLCLGMFWTHATDILRINL